MTAGPQPVRQRQVDLDVGANVLTFTPSGDRRQDHALERGGEVAELVLQEVDVRSVRVRLGDDHQGRRRHRVLSLGTVVAQTPIPTNEAKNVQLTASFTYELAVIAAKKYVTNVPRKAAPNQLGRARGRAQRSAIPSIKATVLMPTMPYSLRSSIQRLWGLLTRLTNRYLESTCEDERLVAGGADSEASALYEVVDAVEDVRCTDGARGTGAVTAVGDVQDLGGQAGAEL